MIIQNIELLLYGFFVKMVKNPTYFIMKRVSYFVGIYINIYLELTYTYICEKKE